MSFLASESSFLEAWDVGPPQMFKIQPLQFNEHDASQLVDKIQGQETYSLSAASGYGVTTAIDPARSLIEQLESAGTDTFFIDRSNMFHDVPAGLCAAAMRWFGLPCQVNVYMTSSRPALQDDLLTAVPLHTDNHATLIFQTKGSKRWQIYRPQLLRPTLELHGYGHGKSLASRLDADSFGEPLLDIVLNAGDVLFVPRGFPHRTWKTEDISVSLTLGLPTTMYQLDTKNLVECAASLSPTVYEQIANGKFQTSVFNQNLAHATKQFDLLRADIPLGFLKSTAQSTIQSLVRANFWSMEWRPSEAELWEALSIYQEEVSAALVRLNALQKSLIDSPTQRPLGVLQHEVVQPLFHALGKRCSSGNAGNI